MTWRLYLSEVILSPGDPWLAGAHLPALNAILGSGVQCTTLDARRDVTVPAGWAFSEADTDAAQHAAAIADPRVVLLPVETAGGVALDLETAAVGDVAAAKRTLMQNRMEAIDIPLQGLTLATTLLQVRRRIKRSLVIRKWLSADDFSEGLETLVSAIPSAKLGRINTKLQGPGFDTQGMSSLTIRAAIKALSEQEVSAFRGF